jgi:hypothetical protein
MQAWGLTDADIQRIAASLGESAEPTEQAEPRLHGLAARQGLRPEDVDPDQLAAGIKVEMAEHTDARDPRSRELAQRIAMDHLAEHPRYYEALAEMERRLEAEEGKG